MNIHVGQTIELGWNGAKYFDEILAYSEVRVEAVGIDWVVIRDRNGRSWATGFPPEKDHKTMMRELIA